MKSGFFRLTLFAMLLGTVFVELNAGATTLVSEQEDHGTAQDIARGIRLAADASCDFSMPGVSVGPPPLPVLEPSLKWVGAPTPALDSPDVPARENSPYKVPNGTSAPAHGGTAPEPGELDHGAKGPALQSTDLLLWKSTGDTPPANPEEWLFRLQYANASSYQAPAPSPLFPIPEPATGALMLMGIAGAAIRRRLRA